MKEVNVRCIYFSAWLKTAAINNQPKWAQHSYFTDAELKYKRVRLVSQHSPTRKWTCHCFTVQDANLSQKTWLKRQKTVWTCPTEQTLRVNMSVNSYATFRCASAKTPSAVDECHQPTNSVSPSPGETWRSDGTGPTNICSMSWTSNQTAQISCCLNVHVSKRSVWSGTVCCDFYYFNIFFNLKFV